MKKKFFEVRFWSSCVLLERCSWMNEMLWSKWFRSVVRAPSNSYSCKLSSKVAFPPKIVMPWNWHWSNEIGILPKKLKELDLRFELWGVQGSVVQVQRVAWILLCYMLYKYVNCIRTAHVYQDQNIGFDFYKISGVDINAKKEM